MTFQIDGSDLMKQYQVCCLLAHQALLCSYVFTYSLPIFPEVDGYKLVIPVRQTYPKSIAFYFFNPGASAEVFYAIPCSFEVETYC